MRWYSKKKKKSTLENKWLFYHFPNDWTKCTFRGIHKLVKMPLKLQIFLALKFYSQPDTIVNCIDIALIFFTVFISLENLKMNLTIVNNILRGTCVGTYSSRMSWIYRFRFKKKSWLIFSQFYFSLWREF